MLGGWRFSAIHVYTSGQPIQLTGGAVSLRTQRGFSQDAGRLGCGRSRQSELPGDVGHTSYFAPICSIAAFCNASGVVVSQTNTLGNAPRFNGNARLQSNLRENVSLQKSFNFTERFRLDFRWEVFNVFNRVILGGPDSSITSQSFGRITSAQPPRQMQFGLKLYF